MTQVKTETGTLLDGIPFGDTVHCEFEIRLPVMKMTGQALEDTEEKYGTIEGYAADSFYRTAVFALALIRLGDIPAEALTAELLNDNLTEDDYDVLSAAIKRLKVKRNGGNPGSPGSDSSPLPSGDTASPKNT